MNLDRFNTRIWLLDYEVYVKNVVIYPNNGGWGCHEKEIPEKIKERIYEDSDFSGDDDWVCSIARFIPEQCIELKDIDKKLIYEGDKIHCKHVRHGQEYDEYFEVVYDLGSFCLKLLHDIEIHKAGTLISFGRVKDGIQVKEKIVGTIHDNREI